ncbi:hypothetical protein ACJX0J_020202, partial [Zea mays]
MSQHIQVGCIVIVIGFVGNLANGIAQIGSIDKNLVLLEKLINASDADQRAYDNPHVIKNESLDSSKKSIHQEAIVWELQETFISCIYIIEINLIIDSLYMLILVGTKKHIDDKHTHRERDFEFGSDGTGRV